MNAVTPSSASETTWNATSSRLCRFTMPPAPRSCAAISSPNRARLNRSAWRADGAGVERARSSACAMPSANASRRRLVDEDAGLAGDDRFERAAAAERDDRPSARLRLERDDAEVLFAGQQRDRRAPVQLADLLVGAASEKLRRRARRRARARRAPGRRRRSSAARRPARQAVDREVDALVGDQRRHDEREPLGSGRRPGGRTRCRRADTPQSPRDYSIGGSCPQHNER